MASSKVSTYWCCCAAVIGIAVALALCCLAPAAAFAAASGTDASATDSQKSSVVLSFDSSNKLRFFQGASGLQVSYDDAANGVKLTSDGTSSPSVNVNLAGLANISADKYRYVVVGYCVDAPGAPGETQLLWKTTGDSGYQPSKSTLFTSKTGGSHCAQTIDLSALKSYANKLNHVRIVPFAKPASGSSFTLTNIGFYTKAPEAEQAADLFVKGAVIPDDRTSIPDDRTSLPKYVAAGYDSKTSDSYAFSTGMSMQFDEEWFLGEFNRMSFMYDASAPLRMDLTYTVDGEDVSDYFFLEAGEGKQFNGLIKGYTEADRATAVTSVSLTPLNASDATFKLTGMDTRFVKVYTDAVTYLENDRLKVGVKMTWGGGICYVQDKTCTVSGLTNMINSYDVGRLVQQSYYGKVYTDTEFMGSGTWNYNPVQGGDMYNNPSRLIDFGISDDQIYVKAQPQDWALCDQITPSYMENTYTLLDDRIQVDNRFSDYSGYTAENPSRHQEMPAFYTVAWLNRFSFYNGTSPWTDAALTTKDNLPWWGGNNDAYFNMASGNTETWCAWTNSSNDFGIGLYTPDISILLAGRTSGAGSSKVSTHQSASYVAPLKVFKIESYTAMEYSYLITTGSVASMRQTFKDNRNIEPNWMIADPDEADVLPSQNKCVIDCSTADAASYFDIVRGGSLAFDSSQDALCMTSSGGDPYVHLDFATMVNLKAISEKPSADDYDTISFTYMLPTTDTSASYTCGLYLCMDTTYNPVGDKRVTTTLCRDGNWHTASVDVGSLDYWKGDIHIIRIDYFEGGNTSGEKFYLKDVTLRSVRYE